MSSRKSRKQTLDQNPTRQTINDNDLRKKIKPKSSNNTDNSDRSNQDRQRERSRANERYPRDGHGTQQRRPERSGQSNRTERQNSKTHKTGYGKKYTRSENEKSRIASTSSSKPIQSNRNSGEIVPKERKNDNKTNKKHVKKSSPRSSLASRKDKKEPQRSQSKQWGSSDKQKKDRSQSSNDETVNHRKDSRKRSHSPSTNPQQPNKKPRKKINPFIHYNDRLNRILAEDPSEIIMALLNDYEAFCEFLKVKDMSLKSVEEILELLSKLYYTPYTKNFAKIFANFQDTTFLNRLQVYIVQLPYQQKDEVQKKAHLERIIQFLNELLNRFPDTCEALPLDALFTCADRWQTYRNNSTTTTANNNSNTGNKNYENNTKQQPNNTEEEKNAPQNTGNSVNEDQNRQIKENILKLKSLRDDILKRKHSPTNTIVTKNSAPDDYRSIPVFPRQEDIFPDKPPFLRKNIVRGRYDDVTHYLDIQFRLLREDYIAPVRDGVQEAMGIQADRSRSLYVYRNVQVVGCLFDTKCGGLLHRVQFGVSRMRRVNWEHSKRFKHGSLYCLIDTQSNMLYFVTITGRNPKDLKDGFVNMKFFDERQAGSIPFQQQFLMIESPAYFESYRHVLEGLQNYNENNLPFQRYLVECNSEVKPPVYLKTATNPDQILDEAESFGVNDREIERDHSRKSSHGYYDLSDALECKAKLVSVLNLKKWPSPSVVNLNNSQYNAFKAALTQEFVAIQGPPGTGKTFVGLRIAKALLANKSVWRRRRQERNNEANTKTRGNLRKNEARKKPEIPSPILIVCYTNHALDQFLEGILQITQNVVRVGSRSKSESLERFNLKARKKMTKESFQWRNLKRELSDLHAKIEKEKSVIESAHKELLHSDVETILKHGEKEQLRQWKRVAYQMQVHRIDAWLKMQDETDDDNRKRKRSNSESNEMTCHDGTPKRSRNTPDSATNLNDDGLSKHAGRSKSQQKNSMIEEHEIRKNGKNSLSSVEGRNTMSVCSCPVELHGGKDDKLDQLEEGELPDSDDEEFRKNDKNDTGYKDIKINEREHQQTLRVIINVKLYGTNENKVVYMNNNDMSGPKQLKKRDKEGSSKLMEKEENQADTKGSVMVIDKHAAKDSPITAPSEARNDEKEIIGNDVKDQNELANKNSNQGEKNDRFGTEYSNIPNDILTEDIEDGEIFDTDDDMSDSDDNSNGGGIDFTTVIGRQIDVIRRSKEHANESVEQPRGVEEAVKPVSESQDEEHQQAVQVDLSKLSEEERHNLYQEWVTRYFEYHQRKIENLRRQYDDILQQIFEIDSIQVEKVLKGVDVIGMTTTGAAKHRLTLQEIKPRIVIVEEAAEVLEGHVIAALSSGTDHLILIGDHKQLKPNPTVYELAKKYNLDVSLFERMVNNRLKCHSLTTQHRMRPEIADIMRIIYPELVDDKSVQHCQSVTGIQHNVYFIDHQKLESQNDELKSHSNQHEVNFVVALSKHLLNQGYDGNRITVLTMYTGQLLNLKRCMPKDQFNGIRISSVDNFQGEESDIIILSLVRSNESGNIGFLNIPNRVCVALSRAKIAMYCIGNISMMAKRNKLWKKIKNHLDTKSMIGPSLPLCCLNHPETKFEAFTAEDFKKAPQGGCMSPCGIRLKCGHVCPLPCHPVDPRHEKLRCKEKCLEELCDLKHRCEKRCHFGEKCGQCTEKVSFIVPSCKHQIEIKCFKRGKVKCTMPCTKERSCGHPCTGNCGEDCKSVMCPVNVTHTLKCGHTVFLECSVDVQNYQCQTPCKKLLDCGHYCPGNCSRCHKGTFHVRCEEPCKRQLVCSHECKEPCTKNCPPCREYCETRCVHSRCPKLCGESCTPCKMPCMWKCEHHNCTKRCGEICDREKCNEPCRKQLLRCGHECVGVCGEFCPKLCRVCNKEELQTIFLGNEDEPDALYIELIDCGHTFEVSNLDYWMEGMEENENSAIQLKVCPRCKTPIRKSLRYGNIVKKTLADIEKVKELKLNEQKQLREKRWLLERRVLELRKTYPELIDYGLILRVNQLPSDADACNTLENQLNFILRLGEINEMFFTGPQGKEFVTQSPKLSERRKEIERLLYERTLLTMQEIKDISDKISFLTLSCQFEFMLWRIAEDHNSSSISEEITTSIETAREIMSREYNASDTSVAITDDERAVVASVIQNVNKVVGVMSLTPKEREEIVKSFKFSKPGHFYKCPNGHIYVITECGGATQKSTCPECKEEIGGSQHKVVESNQLAPEMDGATHSAWSDQGNLLNYDPVELRRLQR